MARKLSAKRIHALYVADKERRKPKPAGYAVLLDDKGAKRGFWFVAIYHDQGLANDVAAKQSGARVEPVYFAAPHLSAASTRTNR